MPMLNPIYNYELLKSTNSSDTHFAEHFNGARDLKSSKYLTVKCEFFVKVRKEKMFFLKFWNDEVWHINYAKAESRRKDIYCFLPKDLWGKSTFSSALSRNNSFSFQCDRYYWKRIYRILFHRQFNVADNLKQ